MAYVLTLDQVVSVTGLRVIEIARFMRRSRGWVSTLLNKNRSIEHKQSTLNLINRVRVIATALHNQGAIPLPVGQSPKFRRDQLGRYWQFMEDQMDITHVNETTSTSDSISHTQ